MSTQKVAIYARFSTSKQTADSIDDQIRVCTAFARDRGFEVVEVFKDEAASGAHSDRNGFNRLRDAALQPRRLRKFDAIVVADLSRLARDIWLMGRVVFQEFLPAGVTLFEATTGVSSASGTARTTFAALGIANDAFLQSVKEKTHTALQGRAAAGFATGGSCFGYRTESVQDAQSGRPRTSMVIDEEQAKVVRLVFSLYADGHGTKAIASKLNVMGLAAPYDGRRHKTNGAGWAHTQVRAMLLNERYRGEVVWNKRKFVRLEGRKNRKAVPRDRSEWIVRHEPELAIIDDGLWSRVQKRRGEHHSSGGGPGRPLGAGKSGPHLLSGILTCGVCGNAMGTVSSGKYGCLRSGSRGYSSNAGCANRLTVQRIAVEQAILGELKAMITNEDAWMPVVQEVMRHLHTTTFVEDAAVALLREEETQIEGRIARLTEALASNGTSTAIITKLSDEETRLKAVRNALRAKRAQVASTVPKITPMEVVNAFVGLANIEGEDRAVANTTLRAYLGRLLMTPKDEGPERGYQASGALNVFVPLIRRENDGCGGRI